jgi:phosphatidyl-myo-inositol dimannoside synthase
MKQKSILFITSEFPPLPGGIGTHACQLSRALALNGYTINLVSDFRSINKQDDLVYDQSLPFSIHRITRHRFLWITYLFRFIKIFQLLLNNRPDVVLTSGKFSLWLGGFYQLFFKKVKWIGVVHGSEILAGGYFSKFLTHRSLQSHDTLIAVSKFTSQFLEQTIGLSKIKVINNGFSLPTLTPLTKTCSDDYLKIITVGNLTERKGQHKVIEVLPELIQVFPRLEYHVVGIPTQLEHFQKKVSDLGLQQHVIIHGMVSDAVKIQLLQKSHIFIMLSQHLSNGDFEGFGIAILEANALGLPAIGSQNSGIADAIQHGYSGFLVNSQEPDEVVQAVQSIVEHYETYSGQARVWSQQFDWDIIVQQYIVVIES